MSRLLLSALLTLPLAWAAPVGAGEPRTVENLSPNSAPAAFAAAELEQYLAKTVGGEEAAASTAAPRIVVGLRDDLPADLAKRLPESKVGYDGYAVSIGTTKDGAALWVIGGDNDRGVVYGAYDVLERVGWRWFHPTLDPKDPEVRPTTTDASLPEGKWAVASPMKTRALIWYVSRRRIRANPPPPERLRKQIDWAMKSRYNSIEYRAIESEADEPLRKVLAEEADRRGMLLQAPGHNFDLFLPDDAKLFEEHPEWFGERRGVRRKHNSHLGAQFCWTNEEAASTFVDNASAFVEARPELDTLTMSALDGGRARPCDCSRCSKKPATDRYLALLNRLTEHLEETAPHVTVEAVVGYQHVEEPPEEVKPHPKLRGRFAAWQRSSAQGYGDDHAGPRLAEWARVFDNRLTAFQYYSDHYAGPTLAPPFTSLIERDRDFLVETGSDGFLNLLYLEGYWWRQTLNGHLAGRAFYDPTLDPHDLLDDYATRYHGEAAAPYMVKYYSKLDDVPGLGSKVWGNPQVKHQRFLEHLRTRQLQPSEKLVEDDSVLRYRLRKARSWHRVAEATIDAGVQTRLARKAGRSGKQEQADAFLESAKAKFAEARALAKEIAQPDDGVLDRDFVSAYTRRFNAVVESVHRHIEMSQESAKTGAAPSEEQPAETK